MAYYRICPDCGAHLDPGESCEDCREAAADFPTYGNLRRGNSDMYRNLRTRKAARTLERLDGKGETGIASPCFASQFIRT